MITMIDYGGSNLRSVQKAFEFVGAEVEVTADPHVIARAEKVVLPGVGAFGAGMAAMKERHLDIAAIEAVERGVPLLGICLGMQFLFDASDEMGQHQGLGLITGQVTRFPADLASRQLDVVGPMGELSTAPPHDKRLKVPHMGWNQIIHDGTHPLLAGVAPGSHAYFVHSYYCVPAKQSLIIARTDYGIQFSSVAGHDHVFGIQFHPEKSQNVGMQILRNYVKM